MRRSIRAIGWGFLALAFVVVTVIVVVGAFRAHGAAAFDRWVGWATIAALPVVTAGVVLVLVDKAVGYASAAQVDGGWVEDQLAAVVLSQAQVARSRLIGADGPGDQAANVRFVRGSGWFREVGGAASGDLVSEPA